MTFFFQSDLHCHFRKYWPFLHNHPVYQHSCRWHWPRGLRRRSTAARLLQSWVRIPPRALMFVCFLGCVLSGRGLCDGLITRPEQSYRLWRVVVCDLETSWKVGHGLLGEGGGAVSPSKQIKLVVLRDIFRFPSIVQTEAKADKILPSHSTVFNNSWHTDPVFLSDR
jgi:hypothetical protein